MSELKFDKSTWKPVTFGDVVTEVRTTTKDPVADGIQRVVGLEHIESECIHLRNWASIEGETTFTKVFRKGQVLFGRRRAYLKKAALADFDGICSGDITVMKAKSDLLPELLPFLVNNDKFFDYAVQHSAGGLSPRTKFKDLANYEFLLPPKDQQAKLAELLWAADAAVEAQLGLAAHLSALKASTLSESFDRGRCQRVRLSEISTNLDRSRKPVKKSDRVAGSIPYYGASGIVDYVEGFTHNEPILLVSEDGENLSSRKLPIAYEVDGKSWVNNHAHAIRVHDGLRHLVAEYLNAADLSDFVSGTTRPKLTKSTLDDLPIYLPPKERRETTDSRLRSIDGAAEAADAKVTCSRHLLKSLINQIF